MIPLTLHYRFGNGPEKTFHSTGSEIIVGRPKDKPIDLDLSPDTKISRPHARFFYNLSTWWVEDLNSKYGTIRNGERLTEAIMLSLGDQLQLGETVLRVDFITADTDLGPGLIEDQFIVNETLPPEDFPEDRRVEILNRVAEIAAHSQSQQAALESFMREIAEAFPKLERGTILLIEDRELTPRAFWPLGNKSLVSFTLARHAITTKQALHWTPQVILEENKPIADSLQGTLDALYAPILSNSEVVGVIHVDTTETEKAFNKNDLELFSVIANIIGLSIKARGKSDLRKLPSLFISYADSDRDFVKRLAKDLRRRQVDVWLDERIRGGDDWCEKLKKTIMTRDAFVVVMSPASVTSEQVQREVSIAATARKEIFPLKYQGCDMPESVRNLFLLDVGEGQYKQSIDELVNQLNTIPNNPKQEDGPMRILFLAANPLDTKQLRLSEEVRTIGERLRSADFREDFDLITEWAVRVKDVSEYLLRHKPHIVHFSGHGEKEGIILEDETGNAQSVSVEALGNLFRILKKNIRCVVLNACLSLPQANAIVKEIDCVVGMSKSIGDQAAINFTGGFYRALGYGESVQTAFDLGSNEIAMFKLGEEATPKLLVKPGIDAASLTFVAPEA